MRSLRSGGVIAILALAAASPSAAGERMFVGYYPSWMDAANPADCGVDAASKLACVSPVYSHVIIAFAKPDFAWDGASWTDTGLDFKLPPAGVRRAVDALHRRNMRVLLAVGGQKYVNWAALAAEGKAGRSGPVTAALTRVVSDLDLDGLDVDYEARDGAVDQIGEYADAISAMRRAADQAGRGKILSLAGWSTGADCTAATGLEGCGGRASIWPTPVGRERLLFRDGDVLSKINIINIMSYDGGTESYDPVAAWKLYRDLVPSRIVVNIGFETAPQGWGDATLVINDDDAACRGAIVLADQFGETINRPYSVERLLESGPLAPRPNGNPRDGAMLWHLLKDQHLPACGPSAAASPREIETRAGALLGRPPADAARRDSPEGLHVQ
ncbi:MAG: hypothetical protein KGJ78_07885 [Alphaproteobacteria bacterium]|nr:hypothetical protein [Alphaproteobacteria bacterium]